MIGVVTASCLTVYAFYTLAPETVEKYETERLALTIPFVIYGIFRYLYLVHRREEGGSPSGVLLTDRPLAVAVVLWAIAVVAIANITAASLAALLLMARSQDWASAVALLVLCTVIAGGLEYLSTITGFPENSTLSSPWTITQRRAAWDCVEA